MYARIVARITRRRFESLGRETYPALVKLYADDARLHFLGDHPLAVECRSRAEIAQWFAKVFEQIPTLGFEVEEIVVQGPPWDTRICVRYVARSTASAREPTLTYRGMQYVRLAWGVLREEWIYPDTQAIARFFAARAALVADARR